MSPHVLPADQALNLIGSIDPEDLRRQRQWLQRFAVVMGNDVPDEIDGLIDLTDQLANFMIDRLNMDASLEHEGLVRYCEQKGIEPEDLDELVIESKCEEATAINNGGIDDQIAYLASVDNPASLKLSLEAMGGSHYGSHHPG